MALRHVVDAHALLWFLAGSNQLGSAAKVVLSDRAAQLVLLAIAFAEACWVIEHRRINVGTLQDFLDWVRTDPRVIVEPLDQDLVEWTTRIGWNGEMHDRQIICTALRLASKGNSVEVISADGDIRASGLVTIVW